MAVSGCTYPLLCSKSHRWKRMSITRGVICDKTTTKQAGFIFCSPRQNFLNPHFFQTFQLFEPKLVSLYKNQFSFPLEVRKMNISILYCSCVQVELTDIHSNGEIWFLPSKWRNQIIMKLMTLQLRDPNRKGKKTVESETTYSRL